jgi:putative tricarboxylic transport membrane protein
MPAFLLYVSRAKPRTTVIYTLAAAVLLAVLPLLLPVDLPVGLLGSL